MRRHNNIVNIDEAESSERLKGACFGGAAKRLGQETGGQMIGCNYFEIAPGRALCPKHWHASNEESIFIIEGTATMRLGDEEVAVRAGDYISFPTGPEYSHRLNNTSDSPLRYLCMSTKLPVDVVGYPDSKKTAALAGPGAGADNWVSNWYPDGADVEYFEGEETD